MVCVFTFIVTATPYGSVSCPNSFKVQPNLSTSVFQVTGACAIPMPDWGFYECITTDSRLLGLPSDDQQAVSNVLNDHVDFVQECFTLKMKTTMPLWNTTNYFTGQRGTTYPEGLNFQAYSSLDHSRDWHKPQSCQQWEEKKAQKRNTRQREIWQLKWETF